MRVLILIPHYLPGFRAGGPVRSVANLIECFGEEHDFRVVTADRDLGDPTPYQESLNGEWASIGKARVAYLPGGLSQDLRRLRRCQKEFRPDLIYINGLFNPRFSLTPLLGRWLGLFGDTPLMIAPHGELNPNALASKAWKKTPALALAKRLGLLRKTTFHATSQGEAEDIRSALGSEARVSLAPNLTCSTSFAGNSRYRKKSGELRLAYLARVIPNKNLHWGLDRLSEAGGPASLDIFGPTEDLAYTRTCKERVEELPEGIRVNWCGQVDANAVSETLMEYDGLLLPTRWENFGYAIVEALGAGCPPVISDQTPWRELQQRGVGWDVSLTSPAAYTRALRTLRDMDEPAHAAMRSKCRDYAAAIAADSEQHMHDALATAAAA